MTGRAGGGWDDPSESPPLPRSRPEPTYTQPVEPQNGGQDLEAASTEQEKRLVEEITAPGQRDTCMIFHPKVYIFQQEIEQ